MLNLLQLFLIPQADLIELLRFLGREFFNGLSPDLLERGVPHIVLLARLGGYVHDAMDRAVSRPISLRYLLQRTEQTLSSLLHWEWALEVSTFSLYNLGSHDTSLILLHHY